MAQIDARTIKEQHREDWDRAAAAWRKYDESLRQGSAPLTRRMMELAAIQPGHRVLDIASGTGEPGLPAAEIAGPSGYVLLTDQSSEMLAVARDKAREAALTNVEFLLCDAEDLQVEPKSFDAVLCRGALPLMPDPPAVLQTAYSALRAGGRIAVTVGGRPEANPYFMVPYLVLRKYTKLPRYEPGAPGPLYFADPDRLRCVLADAGFRELHFETLELVPMEFESGRAYWEYSRGFAGIASVLAEIPTDKHEEIAQEVAALATGGNPEEAVWLKSEIVLAAGSK
jgi:ubiquinone/menaquinone biosynthesis C-methylase UbiE